MHRGGRIKTFRCFARKQLQNQWRFKEERGLGFFNASLAAIAVGVTYYNYQKQLTSEIQRERLEALRVPVISKQDHVVEVVRQLLCSIQVMVPDIPYCGKAHVKMVPNMAYSSDGGSIVTDEFVSSAYVFFDHHDVCLALCPPSEKWSPLRFTLNKELGPLSLMPQHVFVNQMFRKIVTLFARLEQRASLIDDAKRSDFPADVITLVDIIYASGDYKELADQDEMLVAMVQLYFNTFIGEEGRLARKFLTRTAMEDKQEFTWSMRHMDVFVESYAQKVDAFVKRFDLANTPWCWWRW